jgi:hypothetical protein
MPRLSKAQRAAKEARKAAELAAVEANAQVAAGAAGSSARTAPSASSLSTNAAPSVGAELAASPAAGTAASSSPPPALRGAASALVPPAPDTAGVEYDSDISTSGDEAHDSAALRAGVQPGVNGGASVPGAGGAPAPSRRDRDSNSPDELDDGPDVGEEMEARCGWEDCGETFHSLVPFVEHLHDGEWRESADAGGACCLAPSCA